MVRPHLLQQISLSLKEDGHASAYMYNNDNKFGILFHSPNGFNVNDVMIVCATMLLNAVVSGQTEQFAKSVEEMLMNKDTGDQKPS